MDSTLLNRIGRNLEPDDKIQKASKALNEFMSSKECKKRFKEETQKKLEVKKIKNVYYKKYKKPNLNLARKPLEEILQLKILDSREIKSSSLIKNKMCILEFQFKRMNILNKNKKQEYFIEKNAWQKNKKKDTNNKR